MRRLTNIKKSKSPPPSTYSMDNPVFDDGNTSQTSINPIHIRYVHLIFKIAHVLCVWEFYLFLFC